MTHFIYHLPLLKHRRLWGMMGKIRYLSRVLRFQGSLSPTNAIWMLRHHGKNTMHHEYWCWGNYHLHNTLLTVHYKTCGYDGKLSYGSGKLAFGIPQRCKCCLVVSINLTVSKGTFVDNGQINTFIFLKFFYRIHLHVLFWDHLYPCFWISGDVSSGFQSQSGFCLTAAFALWRWM